MGTQREVAKDPNCVEERHASPQDHHLQDEQADRKLWGVWSNSDEFERTDGIERIPRVVKFIVTLGIQRFFCHCRNCCQDGLSHSKDSS